MPEGEPAAIRGHRAGSWALLRRAGEALHAARHDSLSMFRASSTSSAAPLRALAA